MGKRILIMGGGPAGLLAGIAAARQGASVIIVEKMPAPGRKLLITGSGRCNVTNQADIDSFISRYFGQGRFLYPAFQKFFRDDLLSLLAEAGLVCRAENEGKLFPSSGRAVDVLDALVKTALKSGVRISGSTHVNDLIRVGSSAAGLKLKSESLDSDAVIIAAGGKSYPGTGSSGEGYEIAARHGHTISPLRPALVPVIATEDWIKPLKGISVFQAELILMFNGKRQAKEKGDILFTHFGLSGPAILRISRNILTDAAGWSLNIDMLPSVKKSQLISLWQEMLDANPMQQINNALNGPLPARLMQSLLEQAACDSRQKAGSMTSSRLESLADLTKGLTIPLAGTRGYREAMVTAGGVSLKEIDPRTMRSKIVDNLYFAGEVIDIDGDTGGFNLQAAFSTGYLAGLSAALGK